jgi:valyl-tRNA synthetase
MNSAAQNDQQKPKTEKELARERAKAEKLAKFAEKQKKLEAQKAAAKSDGNKAEKKSGKGAGSKVELTEYHYRTGPGEKKGFCLYRHPKIE